LRRSDPRAIVFCLLLGCAAQSRVEAPALDVHDDAIARDGARDEAPRRKPDGVVVEPPAALPSVTERSYARGVIALREPLGGDAVREVVFGLLDAWQHESLDQLALLLTSDAGPMEARSRGKAVLLESWRQRLHAHEYRRLAGASPVRVERIERYGWEDLSMPDAPARPADMHVDELYVRVPLEVTRAAGERLFGDVILLLLRREEGTYKIAAYGETDSP
jgi:hypothetical protein